jgi:hypothetical protein
MPQFISCRTVDMQPFQILFQDGTQGSFSVFGIDPTALQRTGFSCNPGQPE